MTYHDLANLLLSVEFSGADVELDLDSEPETLRCRRLLYEIKQDFSLQHSDISIRKQGTKLMIRKAPATLPMAAE